MAPNWRAVLVQQWLRGLSRCMVMDRPSLQDNLRWVNYQFSEIVSDTKTGWVVLISQNARLSSPVYTHSLMRITMRVNRASVCIYDYGHALFSPFDHILSQIHAPSHSSHYIQPHRRTCLPLDFKMKMEPHQYLKLVRWECLMLTVIDFLTETEQFLTIWFNLSDRFQPTEPRSESSAC